jgi:MFS family permease
VRLLLYILQQKLTSRVPDALTSTALVPWTGGLANIFGRRPILVAALLLFALGSALTGAAQSMTMAIAGRSVQGIGGGAILTMVRKSSTLHVEVLRLKLARRAQSEIIVIDLVPLAERGSYMGILGAVWAIASVAGPPVGGGLATAGAWRWLFYRAFLIPQVPIAAPRAHASCRAQSTCP